MKVSWMCLVVAISMPGQIRANSELDREISRTLSSTPERSIFDSIQFQLGDYNQVTLDGQVTSERVKEAAERDVRAVAGTGRVVNNLKVVPLVETDAEIRAGVLDALRGDRGLKVVALRVTVSQGAVTLDGLVNSEGDRAEAFAAATASAPAVSRIINHLAVTQRHGHSATAMGSQQVPGFRPASGAGSRFEDKER